MLNYSDPEYWDERYAKAGKDVTFDWLENYASLQGALEPYLVSREMKILVLGCGNA